MAKKPVSDLYNLLKNLNMKKIDQANEIVRNGVLFSMGAGLLVPVPILDVAAVSGVQLDMIRRLCKLYDVEFSENAGKTVLSALAGGTAARVGASLIKAIPGFGSVLGGVSMSILSGASSYAIGQVFTSHFESKGTMDNFDAQAWKKAFEEQLEIGKEFAQKIRNEQKAGGGFATGSGSAPAGDAPSSSAEIFSKIEKLNEMKDKGILTEDEFNKKKQELLRQL